MPPQRVVKVPRSKAAQKAERELSCTVGQVTLAHQPSDGPVSYIGPCCRATVESVGDGPHGRRWSSAAVAVSRAGLESAQKCIAVSGDVFGPLHCSLRRSKQAVCRSGLADSRSPSVLGVMNSLAASGFLADQCDHLNVGSQLLIC